MARRFDRGQFRKPVRTDEGFLRAEGFLTRVGVFPYRQVDGTIRRELRLPEEVFKADSLETLQAAPLTNDHPTEAVTPQNAKRFSVGAIGTDARQDGDFVRSTVMVLDAEAIAEVDAGKKRELSCGYNCRLDETPGVHPVHGPYDAVQRDIRHNHVALVAFGRAGPEARLRLDAGDAVMVEPDPPSPTHVRSDSMEMTTIRIDGIEVQVPKAFASAIEGAVTRRDAKVAELTTELEAKTNEVDQTQAKLDASEEKLKAEKARADAAEKPERVRELVEARVSLERAATQALGEEKAKELKLDTLPDLEIRKAVILAASPEAKLEEKSAAYIEARYDQAIEAAPAKDEPSAGGTTALGALRTHAAVPAKRTDAGSAREQMIARNRRAWDAEAATAAQK